MSNNHFHIFWCMCVIISLDTEMKIEEGGCTLHFYEMTSGSHISQKFMCVCVCVCVYTHEYDTLRKISVFQETNMS